MSDVDTIRAGYDAFATADLATIAEGMSPDVVWHVPGRSELAGDYTGTDAVFGYFGQLFERSGGTFSAQLREVGEIAPGLVACRVRITATMPGGTIDQDVVQLYRREDDKTLEAWTFPSDLYAFDETLAPAAISLPDARSAAEPVTT